MHSIEKLIEQFRSEAEGMLGGPTYVSRVDQDFWVRQLPMLYEIAPGLAWSPAREEDEREIDSIGWHGIITLWPGEARATVFRTFSERDQGIVLTTTLVAARSDETIVATLLDGSERWRQWRRNSARVQDATSANVEMRHVAWSEVVLPAAQLEDIRSNALRFAAGQAVYAELGLPYRRGLLFYGAPGNGKTMLCRAIASELKWPVVYVSPSDARDAAHEISQGFKRAARLAPAILWFDDIDGLFNGETTLSHFLNKLDGVATQTGVLVLATTNRPDKLDPALTSRPSRFDRIFEIADPSSTERDRVFAKRMPQLDGAAREELVRRTAGMSMSFVQEVVVGAALRALDRGEPATGADALAVHAALVQHMRNAERGFESGSGAGFVR